MKAIRVTYTVRPDFVATNEANIRAVMDDESKGDIIPGPAAFGAFRAALKGGATSPPQQADWTVVGTSA
ncbi:MAG: hypothetical protein GY913_11535 [Proteobacteria bacterium]|nr:hypothetical protein [Pseudomonadota bacterium]MCP4917546.1 hypothetical protein [Pseudomonadota bacterium]